MGARGFLGTIDYSTLIWIAVVYSRLLQLTLVYLVRVSCCVLLTFIVYRVDLWSYLDTLDFVLVVLE